MTDSLSATLEDYLGVIFHLQQRKRFARVRDIAEEANVAKSAVTAALRTLSGKGLINYRPYEPVTLSPEGNEEAERIILRRRILEDFLRDVLGVDAERVLATACNMEHAVDPEVMERFVCFLAFVRRQKQNETNWLSEFQRFLCEGDENHTCRECIQDYLDRLREEGEEALVPGEIGQNKETDDAHV